MRCLVQRGIPARGMGFACLLALIVSPCFGQSLGDVARRERARKATAAAKPGAHQHVYTNEDLNRPEILVPEDRQRFEASRNQSTPSSANAAPQASPVLPIAGENSLGDVARYYRLLKQIRQAQLEGILHGVGGERVLGIPATSLSLPNVEPPGAPAPVAPAPSPAVAPIPLPPGNDAPLGDVARYYRWLREVREAQSKAAPAAAGEGRAATLPASMPEARPAPAALPAHRPPSASRPAGRSSGKTELEPKRRVRVARGDSFWKLARRHLGSGPRWRELAALNPQVVEPRRLRTGEWIRLPGLSSLPHVAKTFRVRKGDTLWKIAEAQLGSGLAWTCIARANPRLTDSNLIHPDEVLNLPSSCHAPRGLSLAVQNSGPPA